MYQKPKRSFGPIVHHEVDGGFRASCSWCVFRISTACTHVNPSQAIPDPSNTPDWCEMKDGMLREPREMAAEERTA